MDILEIIKQPEYEWLEEHIDSLCFLTIGGSHGYGTNVEGSDVDLRGVILPTKDNILGLNKLEQIENKETDTVLYSVDKFISLASNANPNIIEMLGAREILIFNDIGWELVDNIDLFISKKILHSFGGYANSQLRRVETALAKNFDNEEEDVKYLKNLVENMIDKLKEQNEIYEENSVSSKIEDDKLLLSFNIKDKPIDKIRSVLNDIINLEKTYKQIGNRNTKRDEKSLNKHLLHLVRLYKMAIEILEEGKVKTYRYHDREFLLEIRNGKFIKDGQLTEEFTVYINELEERLNKAKQLNVIPEKPRYITIDDFLISINERIVKGLIDQYDEPEKHISVY